MQMMKEAGAKLQQENVQLKAGVQADMAKIQSAQQTKMAEIDLERQIQAEKAKLAQEEAQAKFALERDKALALLDLKRLEMGASADADYTAAIAKIQSLALIHETKIQALFEKEAATREAAGEAQEKTDAAAQAGAMREQFASAIQEIVKGLRESASAKKSITMTLPDGRKASATVQ
jgi:hypothetical protein